jgi:hypothetical protein
MSYRYLLYGLNVESEIEIEEAYSKDFEGKADVEVVAGAMPSEVIGIFCEKEPDEACSAISGSALAIRIPGVGDYLVKRDRITVSALDSATKEKVKCFLLGSAFGYCMFLRKQVLLHGGAIARVDAECTGYAADGRDVSGGNAGIIITGVSGVGKSTVLDALMERGYKFIADDVCAITDNSGKPHINMAYPQKKLCRDAALKHGYDLAKLIYIGEERDKFAVRLSDGFLPEGTEFKYLFEIVLSDREKQDNNIVVREITGHEKLKAILRNIYRGEDGFALWGISPEYMQKCLKIAAEIQIYQIARPGSVDTLNEILVTIEEILR